LGANTHTIESNLIHPVLPLYYAVRLKLVIRPSTSGVLEYRIAGIGVCRLSKWMSWFASGQHNKAVVHTKSKTKHDVEAHEAEQIFYDESKVPMGIQIQPVVDEPRFGLLGRTSTSRLLHTVFVCC
jgi:hypothetical protein